MRIRLVVEAMHFREGNDRLSRICLDVPGKRQSRLRCWFVLHVAGLAGSKLLFESQNVEALDFSGFIAH